MTSRPDATATSALGGEIVRPRFLAWLDILGDNVRATTWPVSITPTGTGDTDLDGHTFTALDPTLVSITLPNDQVSGSSTITARLSGLILPNSDLFAVIGTRSNWQGRDARLWAAVCDADGVQQGPIWQLYTGKMSDLSINGSANAGEIIVQIEGYLAALTPASNRTYLDQEHFDSNDHSAKASIAVANGISQGGIGVAGSGGGAGPNSYEQFVRSL